MTEPARPLVPAAGSIAQPAWANAAADWLEWASGQIDAHTIRTDRPVDDPATTPPPPPAGTTYPATTLNPRAGRLEAGRPNTHIVFHTTEGAVSGAPGDARRIARWQQGQTGWYRTSPSYETDPGPDRPAGDGWRELYSGYHYIIDEGETVTLADPDTHRAYHIAASGWNRVAIGIAFACQAAQWPTMGEGRKSAMVARAVALHKARADAAKLVPPSRTTTLAFGGYAGHGDLQANRSDPGAGFPWAQFLLAAQLAV